MATGCLPIRYARGRPTGLAAIEFLMALTVVLLLLVALLWIGRVAVNTVTATVQARHDAWRQRPGARPRSFDFTDLTGGIVRSTATAPVTVSPLFDGLIVPRAEFAVDGGSWDHRAERLEPSPNRRLYPVLLQTAVTAKVADLGDITNALDAVAQAISVARAANDQIEQFREQSERQRQEMEALRRSREEEHAAAKQQHDEEFAAVIRQIEQSRDLERRSAAALDGEIAELDRQIAAHAAREPKDAAHRAEAERLAQRLADRRRARQDVERRLRELDDLEAETRREAGA